MKKIIILLGALAAVIAASAQSQSFRQGQWMEIQNSIMREVTRYYVDSLPVDRMYKAGIRAMLSSLDPYTVYVPEDEQEDFEMMIRNSYGGIGAVVHKPSLASNVIINEPYANSPAALAGLRCGDEIVAVDGVSVTGLKVDEATSRMKGKPGTTVNLRVRKLGGSDTVDVKIIRERIHFPNVEYYGMLDESTGYIFQTGFTDGTADEVAAALTALKKEGARRLVLDLRGNGGGLLGEAVKEVGLFVPRGTLVVTTRGTDGVMEDRTPFNPLDTEIPLLVMVDSGSASAAEIVSGALQDLDRAAVMGQRTFGKGLVQKIVPLAYNGQLKVTTSKYYTPSGRCVQAKDYAHRAEDGSVGNIPDSLTREFRTAKGRIVRDGGGITPDQIIPQHEYSRTAYAVVAAGLLQTYPIEYVRKHASIPEVKDFHMSDEEYEEFVKWAETQEFDRRSESETIYDMLVRQMKKDGEYEAASESLAAIEAVVRMDKRTALEKAREEIRPLIEEEIAVRYWFQSAGIAVRVRTDEQLHKALELWK